MKAKTARLLVQPVNQEHLHQSECSAEVYNVVTRMNFRLGFRAKVVTNPLSEISGLMKTQSRKDKYKLKKDIL